VSSPPTPAQPSLLGTGVARSATAVPGKPAARAAQQRLSGKVTFGPADKRKAAQRIYDAYRVHHPRKSGGLTDSEQSKLTSRLRDAAKKRRGDRKRHTAEDWAGAEQDLIDLVEWYHTAPAASWWRGGNPERKNLLRIGTVFKGDTIGDRLDDVAEWKRAGKPTGDGAPRRGTAHRGDDAHDWNDLSDLDDSPRDWIDVQVIESNQHQGGPHGR
jgi:hypothetical protein